MKASRGLQSRWAIPVLIAVCVVPAQAKYSGGAGEPNDPYQIATAADLIALGETPEDYDKHFILTADIDLDPNVPPGKVFDRAVIAPDVDDTAYAFQGTPFTGLFDGNGHRILHVTIRGDGYLGLFGYIGGTATDKVKDLGVVDGDVQGSHSIGGLVGHIQGGSVTQCHSTGVVSGAYYVGGLVGSIEGGSVTQCCSTAVVSTTGHDVGGLVGLVGYGYNGGSVTQSYSTGVVSGTYYVGGLVGLSWSGKVIRCYSTGLVSGIGGGWSSSVGGLVGHNRDSIVTACFWDTQTSGQVTSAGGMWRTTAQMQTAGTFLDAGWDFVDETVNGTEDIWWINEGKDYPKLSWQLPAGMVFVDIPAGTFEMGDHDIVVKGQDKMREGERPVHTVTLDGFQMSKYETTNAQYVHYLNTAMADGVIQVVNGRVYASSDVNLTEPYCLTYGSHKGSLIEYSQGRFTLRSVDGTAMSDHPVVMVFWYGAKAFCDYYGYRLPTEAEWEYAARGGYHDPYYPYPWGSNTIDCTKANHFSRTSGPCNPLNLGGFLFYGSSPVGYYGPQGAYGLCDMAGNAMEWCQDWYDSTYYSVSPAANPAGPAEGTTRVLRGGAWDVDGMLYCRVAFRCGYDPGGPINYNIGFRVCR